MLLNGKQVVEKGYVTLSPYSKETQAGVDLSVFKIEIVLGGNTILTDETIIDKHNFEEIRTMFSLLKTKNGIEERECWHLNPGIYSCTFNEGIEIPNNCQAKITHRSSVNRVGNIVETPWWDAGFKTVNINCTMIVHNSLIVEKNARLAQVVFYEMEPTGNLYNGQWQGSTTAHGK